MLQLQEEGLVNTVPHLCSLFFSVLSPPPQVHLLFTNC